LQPITPLQDRAPLPQVDRNAAEAAVTVPPLQPITPTARESVAPPVERAPVEAPAPAPPAARVTEPPAVTPRPSERPAPHAAPPTREPAARDAAPRDGPSAPSTPFRPPASPEREAPKDYDPTRPALDADALRRRAGELTRQGAGNRAVLPFPMPPVEKPKSKMETAIENARKPDCRTAYQALGLAAVVPLIANEFGEGKCRW
jgi:hypothetical protein